jgi:hypothetical protein
MNNTIKEDVVNDDGTVTRTETTNMPNGDKFIRVMQLTEEQITAEETRRKNQISLLQAESEKNVTTMSAISNIKKLVKP